MTDHTGATLIATLGGQPQVVTFALDALLERGEPIREVYILPLNRDRERTRRAWQRLQQEFIDDHYRGQRCRLRRVTVTRDGSELDDIRTDADVNAVFTTIRNLIIDLKKEERRLHLCLSGGRRMIALLAVSVAFLFCDHRDQVWHMYTPDETLERVKDGTQMHLAPTDGFRLLSVPIVPWGEYLPALRQLADPTAIRQRIPGLVSGDEARCRQVWDRLTGRQRDVLRAFAKGLRPDQVADHLCISLSTVNSHKTVILNECRIAWGLTESVDYRFVREHFSVFIEQV
ncbi:CRISPR-associated ring nuclease [Chloroflexus sp.]|uniref:CRISPR-associated ring nuclease n=1 Tax=Chloroflexus sp. TaxID=1904827 RepID=UPI0026192BF9|nr:CRISPR-associated ring nuclease [uncultured Chloroflexus sp.]